MALHDLGRQAEFEAAFAELREQWARENPVEIAQVYAWTGEADAAFEWLEKSTPPNKIGAIYYLRDPAFAKLHTDPRWHALLERLGLAPEQLGGDRIQGSGPSDGRLKRPLEADGYLLADPDRHALS